MKKTKSLFLCLCVAVTGLGGCTKKAAPEPAVAVSESKAAKAPSKELLIACAKASDAAAAQVECVSAKGAPIITKLDDATVLHLASGDLRFDEVHSDGESQMEVEYAGYLAVVNAHVLQVARYESGETLLIDHSTGEQRTVGPDFFKVSADGEYLIQSSCTSDVDICAWSLGKYRGEEQVWACNLPYVEFDVSWAEPERIELRRNRAFTERGEKTVAADRDYSLTLKDGKWQSDLSCLSDDGDEAGEATGGDA